MNRPGHPTSRRPASTAASALAALALAVACPATGANAQEAGASQLSEEQVTRLLQELSSIRDKIVSGKENINQKALSAFKQAAVSDRGPYDFHLECVNAVDFEKTNRRESEFREWKSSNDDFLKSPEHVAVLRCQLLYLIAMLEADQAKSLEEALPALNEFLAYAAQTELLLANPEKLKGGSAGRLRGVAASGVLATPFAKRFQLDITLKAPEGWPDNPREIDTLYENVVLPYYRKKPDAEKLAASWDQRIGRIRAIAAIAQEEEDVRAYQEMTERRIPILEWGKARDAFAYGNQLAGAQSMLAIIRDNLAHPNAEQWIADFSNLVQGKAAEVAAPSAPSEGATLGDLLNLGSGDAPQAPPPTGRPQRPPAPPEGAGRFRPRER